MLEHKNFLFYEHLKNKNTKLEIFNFKKKNYIYVI